MKEYRAVFTGAIYRTSLWTTETLGEVARAFGEWAKENGLRVPAAGWRVEPDRGDEGQPAETTEVET